MQRSAISVISLSTETGRATCLSSPARSIASMNARRLSSAMVDGADPAGQQLVADVAEPRVREAGLEVVRVRKIAHILWQVGISYPMMCHRPPGGVTHDDVVVAI